MSSSSIAIATSVAIGTATLIVGMAASGDDGRLLMFGGILLIGIGFGAAITK